MLLLALLSLVTLDARFVMPWMCLEDCGFNSTQVQQQIDQLGAPGVFTHASFEDWDLINGVLSKGSTRREQVSDRLFALGLGTHAMILSWNLDDIRAAFKSPAAFIASVEQQLLSAEPHVTGVNLDFEPAGTSPPVGPKPTAADAAAYAAFLDTFAAAMHARTPRIEVSVDIAKWSAFWDYSLLNSTAVDFLCDMESYNADIDFFRRQVDFASAKISPGKYVAGLITSKTSGPDEGKPFNSTEIGWRFDYLKEKNVQQIAIWSMPMPELWMPFLKGFQ